MSTQTFTKKRKSADGTTTTAKKVKVTKSAEKPAPSKSALKKPQADGKKTLAVSRPVNVKAQKSKPVKAADVDVVKTKDNGPTVSVDNEDGGVELSADQTADLLAGFSSSEDEAESGEDEAGVSLSSIPKVPTTGAIQKRIKQAIAEQNDPETTPGVVYVGRIPHGFYEHQMKAYFSQFGQILNLKLARNPKTGRSRHFAFVEFASAAVSDIVTKTMDKYLLFGHLLQVRRVPREQVNEGLFQGSGRRKKPAPMNRLEGSKLKRGATREEWEKRVEKENMKRTQKAEKLKEMGYDFDMPVAKSVAEVPVKAKATGEAVESGHRLLLEQDEGVKVDAVEASNPSAPVVFNKAITKKRTASGKTEVKKAVKKVKA